MEGMRVYGNDGAGPQVPPPPDPGQTGGCPPAVLAQPEDPGTVSGMR